MLLKQSPGNTDSQITYDSQIVLHNSCSNLFILHNNSFDNQGSEIIFLRFDKLTFTKTFFLLHIQ